MMLRSPSYKDENDLEEEYSTGMVFPHENVSTAYLRTFLYVIYDVIGRKIPESPWGSPIPIGDGDGDVNRFPDGDGDGDGDEAEKRGWGLHRLAVKTQLIRPMDLKDQPSKIQNKFQGYQQGIIIML
ncbi:hypothetical protein Tco_1034099 [Tanacetum coccineum]